MGLSTRTRVRPVLHGYCLYGRSRRGEGQVCLVFGARARALLPLAPSFRVRPRPHRAAERPAASGQAASGRSARGRAAGGQSSSLSSSIIHL